MPACGYARDVAQLRCKGLGFAVGLEVDVDNLKWEVIAVGFGRKAHMLNAPFSVSCLGACVLVVVVGEDGVGKDDDGPPAAFLVVVV